jgi:hypothetical protein
MKNAAFFILILFVGTIHAEPAPKVYKLDQTIHDHYVCFEYSLDKNGFLKDHSVWAWVGRDENNQLVQFGPLKYQGGLSLTWKGHYEAITEDGDANNFKVWNLLNGDRLEIYSEDTTIPVKGLPPIVGKKASLFRNGSHVDGVCESTKNP